MTRRGHTLRSATMRVAERVSRWGNPAARQPKQTSRPDRGKVTHVGNGESQKAKGPDEASERALFKVLDTNDSSGGARHEAAGRRISGRSVLGLLVIAAVIASAFVAIPLASSANPDIADFELDGNIVDDRRPVRGMTGPRCSTRVVIRPVWRSARAVDFVDDPTRPVDTGVRCGLERTPMTSPPGVGVPGLCTPGEGQHRRRRTRPPTSRMAMRFSTSGRSEP